MASCQRHLGAYEFGLACDLDGDCLVGPSDLAELLGNYGMTTGAAYDNGDVHPPGRGNGDIDLQDLTGL